LPDEVGRHARDDLLLVFAVAGGATAWTLQLWPGWLAADLGCRLLLATIALCASSPLFLVACV